MKQLKHEPDAFRPALLRLSAAIRWARQRAGLSQAQASGACGWKAASNGNAFAVYESGRRDPQYTTLLLIAERLGVSIVDLMTYVPPEPGAEVDVKPRKRKGKA